MKECIEFIYNKYANNKKSPLYGLKMFPVGISYGCMPLLLNLVNEDLPIDACVLMCPPLNKDVLK